jgi:AhpD family alkylhydroperoxidase
MKSMPRDLLCERCIALPLRRTVTPGVASCPRAATWTVTPNIWFARFMARLDVPDGPGGEAAMIWTLRPQLGDMVERMIRGAYQQSILPPDERELARMRIAQINDCVACSDFRADSVLEAGVAPELYENVAAYATYPGYTARQRLAIEYAERFANDHASIDDAFFGRLRAVFTDEELLDLTLCVAVFLGLGRSLSVLGVDQSCAIDL